MGPPSSCCVLVNSWLTAIWICAASVAPKANSIMGWGVCRLGVCLLPFGRYRHADSQFPLTVS